jgi:general secretion pathway protein I
VSRRESGMTLLEVLVASVIMAVAVVGLLGSLTTSMKSAARLTDYDRGTMLARNKMDELLAQTRLPRMTMLEGRFDPVVTSGMEAGWRARIGPFESLPNAPAGSLELERVELEVWWMVGDQRKTFTLEGFRNRTITPEEAAAGAG